MTWTVWQDASSWPSKWPQTCEEQCNIDGGLASTLAGARPQFGDMKQSWGLDHHLQLTRHIPGLSHNHMGHRESSENNVTGNVIFILNSMEWCAVFSIAP